MPNSRLICWSILVFSRRLLFLCGSGLLENCFSHYLLGLFALIYWQIVFAIVVSAKYHWIIWSRWLENLLRFLFCLLQLKNAFLNISENLCRVTDREWWIMLLWHVGLIVIQIWTLQNGAFLWYCSIYCLSIEIMLRVLKRQASSIFLGSKDNEMQRIYHPKISWCRYLASCGRKYSWPTILISSRADQSIHCNLHS